MKIKTKSILSIILALNLVFPIGYMNNIDSYATTINKSGIIDTWETKTNMPTPRKLLTSAVVNGKIYCIGGEDSSTCHNKVEVYDPVTDTWETKTNMPTKRSALTSEVVNGKIYCIGGYDGSSYLNTVEVYDPKTDTWETKTNMPTSRYVLASAVVNGKIYCIGGYNSIHYNKVEVYDPETDTWEIKTPMPTKRGSFTSAVVDGKIYCIGGGNSTTSYLNTVEVYDPKTDTWETKTHMPAPRKLLTSAVVNGKIYCIGGEDSSSRLNKVEVYDPATDTWETKTSMPSSRYGLVSEVVNGKIYCIGGYNSFSKINIVEAYVASTSVTQEEAEEAVIKAEQSKDPTDIDNARDLVNQLPDSPKKDELNDRLDAVELDNLIINAEEAVIKAEQSKDPVDIDNARDLVNQLPESPKKEELNNRLDAVELDNLIINAEEAVIKAEQSKDPVDIDNARDLVNQLPESSKKDELNDRLDALLSSATPPTPQEISANVDTYITMKNTLCLSLDTNLIIFEGFSGVEDAEKLNAVNLTVESSLPYEINASLEGEIQNTDKTETLDKSILGIRANGDVDYKSFVGVDTSLNLLDSQETGTANIHGIDLKLNKNVTYKSDVYKAVIKFEVNQK